MTIEDCCGLIFEWRQERLLSDQTSAIDNHQSSIQELASIWRWSCLDAASRSLTTAPTLEGVGWRGWVDRAEGACQECGGEVMLRG